MISIVSSVAVVLATTVTALAQQAAHAVPVAAYVAPPAVTDVSPNSVTSGSLWGGREQGIAVDPVNTQNVYSASELGGIWHSTDGGAHWSHVDAVPLSASTDVKIAAADSNLVIATGSYDGAFTSNGGIWRSTDGGSTWSKPAGSDPTCTTEPSATRISIGPGSPGSLPVFVGDSCGVTYSMDSGATWTHVRPNNTNGVIYDVKARKNGANLEVDACGDAGYFRSENGGSTWTNPVTTVNGSPSTNPFATFEAAGAAMPCAVDVAPQNAGHIFLASYAGLTPPPVQFCNAQLQESDDGGATWSFLNPASDQNCRFPWVTIHPAFNGDANHFDLFYGTTTKVLHQYCDGTATPSCGSGGGSFNQVDGGAHSDPATIVFDPRTANGCAMFLGTDGGMESRIGGSACDLSGGGPFWVESNVGLHALDAPNPMAGTVFAASTSLNFGTQDNGLWNTEDGGANYTQQGPDVYDTFADHNGPPSKLLWRSCFGCGVNMSDLPAVTNTNNGGANNAFSAPPGNDIPDNFTATQFGFRSYAFITPDAAPNPKFHVYVSTNVGAGGGTTWTQMGSGDLPGGPGEIRASGPASSPTFYLRLGVGGLGKIYRLAGPLNGSAVLTEVDGSGANTLSSAANFAVSPVNPNLLYATDVGSRQMKRSTNGGQSWTVDSALTSLVTQSGKYKFLSGNGQETSAIAFDGHSSTVMVGTQTAGIYASPDGGNSWLTVRGAQGITRTTGFFFDERTHTIYAGTAGRGLWKINLPQADLSITKTHTPDPVTAGTVITYTITVKNNGPDPAGQITVTDNLPSSESYLNNTNSCVESPPGSGQLTCSVPDQPNGGSYSFTIRALVNSNASQPAGSSTISNTATVSSADSVDSNTSNNSATDNANTSESADLAVTKSCPSSASAGQTMTCTIYVDNLGPSDARNVIATDAITSSGSFTVSSATSSPAGSCSTSTPNPSSSIKVTCQLGSLAAASATQTGRDTITVQMTASQAQSISDTASVHSDTADPNPENNQASSSIAVSAASDLAITSAAGTPNPVDAGTDLTYVIQIQNGGPSTAVNVVLKNNIPAGVTVKSVSSNPAAGCNAGVPGDSTQPATCNFGNMNGGATATMTIVVTVKPQTTGTLHLDSRVSSDTFDPNMSNNLAHVTTNVTAHADMGVTISNMPNPVTAGTILTYTATATNNGPSTALNVTLAEGLPSGTTFNGLSVTHGTANCSFTTPSDHSLLCQLGTMNPGDYVTVVVSVKVLSSVPPTTVLSNTATVASDTPDPSPDPTPDSQTASATVQTSADVGITQSSDVKVLQGGNPTINDTVTVANAGPSDARTVVVTISLPPADQDGYGYMQSGDTELSTSIPCTLQTTSNNNNQTFGTLTCHLGHMTAGATTSFVVTQTLEGNFTSVSFQANVTSITPDPNLYNNSSNLTIAQPVDITCTDQTLTYGYANVTVATGHGCLILGAQVTGNIIGHNITYLGINGTVVSGDVNVDGVTSTIPNHGDNFICNSNIGGQLSVQHSSASSNWVIGDTEEDCTGGGIVVNKNITFNSNAGSWGIADGDYESNLQCSSNTGAKDGQVEDRGSNYVAGSASGQCADLSTHG